MKKSKQENVYSFWSASILLCLLLVCFSLIFASCAKKGAPKGKTPVLPSASPSEAAETPTLPAAPETPIPGIAVTPSAQAPASGARLGETEDMGQEYVDKFVFLGDSTTNGLAHYDIVPKTQVWTPASGTLTLAYWSTCTIVDRSDNSEDSIKNLITEKKPEYILITLGVNGISFMDEKYFTEEYTNLVNAIKEANPSTKIILNSMYPVTKKYSDEKNGITNEKITAANVWVENVATATGVKYLDSATLLKDANGNLVETYDNDDGLHLNGETFKLVIDNLRKHGYK
ncbi:MAG: GDSL-type esterase/lipase family protein [Oscillospiraceae bacterium]